MEHIAAILLLLGCNDSASVCNEIPAPQVGYETMQSCEEETPALLSAAGSDYPLVLAKCFAVDPLAEGDMEIVWDLNSRGELVAEVVPFGENGSGTMVAGLPAVEKPERIR
jgi:hypothetical protein